MSDGSLMVKPAVDNRVSDGSTPSRPTKRCSYQNVKAFRYRMKARVIAYLGGKCVLCGYDKCARALCVHHLDPSKKEFAFSKINFSWEKVERELQNCVLLCANCHMEVHEGMHKDRSPLA